VKELNELSALLLPLHATPLLVVETSDVDLTGSDEASTADAADDLDDARDALLTSPAVGR